MSVLLHMVKLNSPIVCKYVTFLCYMYVMACDSCPPGRCDVVTT